MNSAQKKRKSDVYLDPTVSTQQPTKKEKPWYDDKSRRDIEPFEKERRKSFLGLGGLLKKMRSSSTLKERNRETERTFPSTSSSSTNKFINPSLSTLEHDDASFQSESSVQSSDSLPLPIQRNAELLRFVENIEREPSEAVSFTTDSCSSGEEPHSQLGSVASLCTPHRGSNFIRGHLRSSARSMPTESDLVSGLCNSAVRRTMSSVSDSYVSPRDFLRRKSMRLREKLTGSMADLPEEREEFPPLAEAESEEFLDNDATTPMQDDEIEKRRDSKNGSLLWSKRSKSRIFGSRKRNSLQGLSVSTIETTPVNTSIAFPPETRSCTLSMKRSTPSSSSLHRKMSAVIKKSFGIRSVANTATVKQHSQTPAGIIKRSATGKEGHRMMSVAMRRCSDITNSKELMRLQQRSRRIEEAKVKENEDARLFLEKVRIADEPVLDLLEKGGFDAVVVDVMVNGKPVSPIAEHILTGKLGDDIHHRAMQVPYRNGIIERIDGPNVFFIMTENSDPVDKRIRVGIAAGMREAFENGKVLSVLMYPMFCKTEEEWDLQYNIDQFLITSFKVFGFRNRMAKEFAGCVTLAGVTRKNVQLLKNRYENMLEAEIKCKLREENSLNMEESVDS